MHGVMGGCSDNNNNTDVASEAHLSTCSDVHDRPDVGDDDDGQVNMAPFAHAYVACTEKVKHVMTPRGMRAITVPKTHNEAMSSPYAEEWKAAEMKELETLQQMGAWEAHPLSYALNKKAQIYRCKWAYDVKTQDGKLDKLKARLCFVGIQQRPDSYDNVFSTCVRYASVRTILAIGAARGWSLFNLDIRGAYLYAKMDRELFMREPPGHERKIDGEQAVLVVKRALYGAKQSGHLWRRRFDTWLQAYGFEPTTHDDCVYILRGNDSAVQLVIGVWVDDIIAAAATDKIRSEFTRDLRKEFTVDDRGDLEWVLGMKVDYDRAGRTVKLSSAARVHAMCTLYGIESKAMRKYATPADQTILDLEGGDELTKEGKERAQQLIGALIYVATTCRPDIAHAVYRCAVYMSKPNSKVWSAALRILAYLQSTAELGLTYDGGKLGAEKIVGAYKPFGPAEFEGSKGHLHSLSDANWEVGRSITGYVISLHGCAIAWSCKKQPATALSSTEAELYAASAAAAELIWTRGLMAELGVPQEGATPLWVDNQGAVAVAKEAQSVGRSRHIARRAHFLQEAHEAGEMKVMWVDTGSQVADILTKPLVARQYEKLRSYMMNAADTNGE